MACNDKIDVNKEECFVIIRLRNTLKNLFDVDVLFSNHANDENELEIQKTNHTFQDESSHYYCSEDEENKTLFKEGDLKDQNQNNSRILNLDLDLDENVCGENVSSKINASKYSENQLDKQILQEGLVLDSSLKNVNFSHTFRKKYVVILRSNSKHDAQFHIQNAKSYIKAHLPSSSGFFENFTHLSSPDEIKMVQTLFDDIQERCGVLAALDLEQKNVTISGLEPNVLSAQNIISMLLEKNVQNLNDQEKKEIIQTLFSQSSLATIRDGFVSSFLKSKTEKRHSMPTHLENNELENGVDLPFPANASVQQFHVKPTESEDLEVDGQQPFNENNLPFERYSINLDNNSLCMSDRNDTKDEEHIKVLSVESEKKLHQAMKLGYSEDHVKRVLASRGECCDLNDLLSDLIKLEETSGVNDVKKSMSSDSLYDDVELPGDSLDEQLNAYFRSNGHSFDSREGAPSSPIEDLYGSSNLRHIIIDGSNVAMSHGKKLFSCQGIKIAVDWFREKGHQKITAFVPQWRKETSRPDAPISDQDILLELEQEGFLVFTPSRRIKGRRVVCYDDRYVLQLAVDTDGIVVSNDVYRDLVNESDQFRQVVDHRLLMYTFVNDRFMPPQDPLGRLGPSLDNFLRKIPVGTSEKPQDCPYGKKCTYGNKCRFYHPERGFKPQKSVTDTLKKQAEVRLHEMTQKKSSELLEKGRKPKQKLARTKSVIPVDSLSSNTSDFANLDKNKLSPTRSLGSYNGKKSNYLSEPRKKLEAASVSDVFQDKACLESVNSQNKHVKKASIVSSRSFSPVSSASSHPSKYMSKGFDSSRKNAVSARSSPVNQLEVIKASVSTANSFPLAAPTFSGFSCPPMKVEDHRSRLSPTHLTVPKTEMPEKLVSGHLLLAKKLSDDGDEFFDRSSHTSPVTNVQPVPADKMLLELLNDHPRDIIRQDTLPSGYYSVQKNQGFTQEEEELIQITSGPVPNLSIFNKNANSPSSIKSDFDETRVTDPHTNMERITPDIQIQGESADSGLFSQNKLASKLCANANTSLSTKYVNTNFNSCKHKSPGHQELRRSASSNLCLQQDEKNQNKQKKIHQPLKAQHSVPVHLQQQQLHFQNKTPSNFPDFHGLLRQNSTSDPQLNYMKLDNFSNQQLSTYNHNQPATDHVIPDFLHRSRGPVRVMEEQKNAHYFSQQQIPVLGQPLQAYHLSPVHSGNHKHAVHFSNPPPLYQQQQQQQHQQPLVYYIPQNHHPVPSRQMTPVTQAFTPRIGVVPFPVNHAQTIPVSEGANRAFLARGDVDNYQRSLYLTSKSSMPPSFSDLNQEQAPYQFQFPVDEAPILPTDPRYATYKPLSKLFEERIVKKVMNLNPTVNNPDELCTLIIAYKQKMI